VKYLICSDIHGDGTGAEIIVNFFTEMNCDKLILLGDILYHGPRNPLPGAHSPPRVVEILNTRKDRIIACRGNCDAEVDQMLLQFPITGSYCLLFDGTRQIFVTHGHIWSPEKLPGLEKGDVFLYGHTHIQELRRDKNGIIICNPGSVSLPKNGSKAGFAVCDGAGISLYSLDGKESCKLMFQDAA